MLWSGSDMSLLFTEHWPKLVRLALPNSQGTQIEDSVLVSTGNVCQPDLRAHVLITMLSHFIKDRLLQGKFPLCIMLVGLIPFSPSLYSFSPYWATICQELCWVMSILSNKTNKQKDIGSLPSNALILREKHWCVIHKTLWSKQPVTNEIGEL